MLPPSGPPCVRAALLTLPEGKVFLKGTGGDTSAFMSTLERFGSTFQGTVLWLHVFFPEGGLVCIPQLVALSLAHSLS